MEKRKRWQLCLILAVLALTFYHILPTLFYYLKPLHHPITESQAKQVANSIEKRIFQLEGESREWIHSFCKLLRIKPQSIEGERASYWVVRFAKSDEAALFRRFLPRAGLLIPFVPAQLGLVSHNENLKEVIVQRRIPVRLKSSHFSYAAKGSSLYRDVIVDRASQIAYALTGKDFPISDVFEVENPLFSKVEIDWTEECIALHLRSNIDPIQMRQSLIDEVAKVVRLTRETVEEKEGKYVVPLHALAGVSGLLVLNLEEVASDQVNQILSTLKQWKPRHPDLQEVAIADALKVLPDDQKALSLIVHSPTGKDSRLRIVLRGMEHILKKYEGFSDSEPARLFRSDFEALVGLLQQYGFVPNRNSSEVVFEKIDAFHSLLAATREKFQIKGTQRMAFLEFSDLEQRILASNRIDTEIHEDLRKWKDEYNAAQVSMQPEERFCVPKPTRNTFLSNLVLSWTKLFRGDEKRVIRWGLDLSGGKTVQIELCDVNHHVVVNEEDLKQGINELYNRVNRMGVSEVAIRRLGNTIVLDFPGSQSLQASELIKASSMYFHVVNEKFSSLSSPHAEAAQRFLQEIWNEALVTNRKDELSLNEIAWRHLHSERISEAARALLESGFVLQPPEGPVDDSVSKIALIRGEPSQWFGQGHPLLIVFRNYALEGSQLGSIHSGYDPQKGNYLSFEVNRSGVDKGGQKINPRNQLEAWTSRYSKEKILGTPLEDFSKGRGWRMAVVLNDTAISAPTLDAVIRDSASISGNFSQREVHQLASDLKAGSLSFTPRILSERNVSAELGMKDRNQGIWATTISLLLVIGSMVIYYRFAGLVASVAVLFNLLILWAVLQNMGAALSLAGIAGIILTVGMAVDANVLVFERVKEEFSDSGNIASAISAGYKKAYSAIIDSNVTTIIAALILLNFDAGPIKGFAMTLIIGIISSMFTALFMTRFYFSGWVQNPKHKALSMANWIRVRSVDFLKWAKWAFPTAAVVILVGFYFLYAQRASVFGMDFTGGFSLHLEMRATPTFSLQSVEEALQAQGATTRDFQVRELDSPHRLRLLLARSMEQPGKPFFGMPLMSDQANPRIEWVVSALQARGLELTEYSKEHLKQNWTAMSSQMSDSMCNQAVLGLLLSLICIFIYIAFRFEYRFAIASTLCLLHDALITIGCIGILHFFDVPVQIDLSVVAAIMTVIGYSLNDTIIIFDRIREEMRLSRGSSLVSLINGALNATLSRTSITSGTTLLVLIALLVFGGPSIFSFALVMTIGVLFGTLSSWYIASPLALYLHQQAFESALSFKGRDR